MEVPLLRLEQRARLVQFPQFEVLCTDRYAVAAHVPDGKHARLELPLETADAVGLTVVKVRRRRRRGEPDALALAVYVVALQDRLDAGPHGRINRRVPVLTEASQFAARVLGQVLGIRVQHPVAEREVEQDPDQFVVIGRRVRERLPLVAPEEQEEEAAERTAHAAHVEQGRTP